MQGTSAISAKFIKEMTAQFPGSAVLSDPADMAAYRSDQSGLTGALPLAVLRPASVDALVQAVALCARNGVGMVAQGGQTGLSAGAVGLEGAVILSTRRIIGIEEIDEDAMTMTVLAGTPLERVQEAARARGLDYPVDIGARGSATIGGTIATNAGGIRVLRHGMTRQSVLGLDVVLADGTLLAGCRKLVKDNSGYDLKQAFIGSEGTLGIIARAVLRLVPFVPATTTAVLACTSFETAMTCLRLARARFGNALTAFEGMWPDYWRFVCGPAALATAPYAGDHGFHVLLEVSDPAPGAGDRFESWFAEIHDAGLVQDGVLAASLAEVRALWSLREAVGEVDLAFGPHTNFDLGIAPSRLGGFCDAVDKALGSRPRLKVGHMGDGNVHLLVAHDGSETEAAKIEAEVYRLLADWGGVVTAEHGVGRLKRHYLRHCRSPAEIDAMRLLKSAFDPKGLLNPGAVL